jgi:ubiquinone/menaquinone biosynthesis C-methylase UbiE
MAKPEWIAHQSRRPSGWLGEIVARVMSIETAPANRAALDVLALQRGEDVLEVGCGHGRTLARVAAATGAHVAGIDPSDVMVRVARRRLRHAIAAGRAEIARASCAAIPHPDARFDAAFAVHVVYFWREPQADLAELHRVLRPGGRLLLGYKPRDERTLAALPASVYALRKIEEIEALLGDVGFREIRTEGRSEVAYTLARR